VRELIPDVSGKLPPQALSNPEARPLGLSWPALVADALVRLFVHLCGLVDRQIQTLGQTGWSRFGRGQWCQLTRTRGIHQRYVTDRGLPVSMRPRP
jgi:hypothetical protein